MSSPTQPLFGTIPDAGPIVSSKLIASLLNLFFYGTLVVQFYAYRFCFPKDSLGIKILVHFIFLAMTLCVGLNVWDVEVWFGIRFGNLDLFLDPLYAWFYSPLMGSFIATLVQLFFCWRIFVIRRTAWRLALLIALVSLAQLAGGIGCGILVKIGGNEVHDRLRTILVYFWLVGGALSDVLIAIAMSFLLLRASVVGSTRIATKNAVRLIIETNTVSSLVALSALLLFLCAPNTTYSFCPFMILPGIYANTLLGSLNNRIISRFASDSDVIDLSDNLVQSEVTFARSPKEGNRIDLTQATELVDSQWGHSQSILKAPKESKISRLTGKNL